MKLGEIVKTKRIECGMSQIELANLVKVPQRVISDIEAVSRIPSFHTVCMVIEALRLDVKEVWLQIKESKQREKTEALYK